MIRYLRAALGIVSPSVVASVRRADPPPASWLARRERELALLWLGDVPSLAERADAEAGEVVAFTEAVARIVALEAVRTRTSTASGLSTPAATPSSIALSGSSTRAAHVSLDPVRLAPTMPASRPPGT